MPYFGEILAIGAALSWAMGVILFKKSGENMLPLALNFFKTLLGALWLLPTAWIMGDELAPAQPIEAWLLVVCSGVIGIALADTLFFISLEKLGASLTAVVDTSYLPFVFGISFVVLGERTGFWAYSGGAVILVALLVGSAAKPDPGKTRADIVQGVFCGLLGIALVAFGIVMIKQVLNNASMLWVTWLRVLAGGVGLVPLILANSRRRELIASLKPGPGWKFAVPAAFCGTYLAMICWIGGMKYIEVSRAAALNQLSTIFIFILAAVFLREPVTPRRMAAIGLACAGAMLVLTPWA